MGFIKFKRPLLTQSISTPQLEETDAMNVVKVYDASDLPNTLVTLTKYVLFAPITLTQGNELTIPAGGVVIIDTTNLISNTITYTGSGTLFQGTNVVSVLVTCAVIGTSSGTLHGISGIGGPSVFFWLGGGFRVWGSLGTLTNWGIVGHNDCRMGTFDEGLSLVTCNSYVSSFSIWNLPGATVDFLTFDSNISDINILSVAYEPASADRIFNINSSATPTAFIMAVQRVASADRYFKAGGLDQTVPGVIARDCAALQDSGTTAEVKMSGNTLATDIPAAGANVEIASNQDWIGTDVERLVVATSGAVTSIGLRPANLKIDANINLEPANASKSLSVCTILVEPPPITVTFTNGTNIVNETGTALANGDRISFRDTVGTLPAELRKDIVYRVVSKATNTFQLSYTEGGSAIAFTDNGTPVNSYQNASLHGSTPTNAIAAGSPRDLIPQATVEATLESESFLVVINNDDAVNITVNNGYQRYFA